MGGGIGMGNTCKPMAVLFQCMTKFTTNKKKKKKKEKKRKKKRITCKNKQHTFYETGAFKVSYELLTYPLKYLLISAGNL